LDISFKAKLISLLKEIPVYKSNSIDTQHTIRCPYCGDSRNANHGHFSIKIDQDTLDSLVFRCVKCEASGLLTPEVLEELGIYITEEIKVSLKSFNKKIIKTNNFITKSENFITPRFQDNNLNSIKLNYINSRLGTNYDYNQAQELKIILDLHTFLKINDIKEIPNINNKYLYLLNNNYVGFLSTNNNCITLRRINDNERFRRYDKIILNPKNINSNTFYSIPNTISLMYTDDINIHTSEGIFDILSIYNMNNKEKNNNYYFASCGFGYLSIFKYLIYHGINTGLNINIYADKDKTDRDHLKLINKSSGILCWFDGITLHRNGYSNEKDYGVPLEKIIDTKYKIK
jgi:hypothetical protein